MFVVYIKMNIRKGIKSDLPSVFRLVNELALFEKAPEAVTNTIADMEKDGFSENPVFGFHVAEVDHEIVGIAVYFIKYSTWKAADYIWTILSSQKKCAENESDKNCLMHTLLKRKRWVRNKLTGKCLIGIHRLLIFIKS